MGTRNAVQTRKQVQPYKIEHPQIGNRSPTSEQNFFNERLSTSTGQDRVACRHVSTWWTSSWILSYKKDSETEALSRTRTLCASRASDSVSTFYHTYNTRKVPSGSCKVSPELSKFSDRRIRCSHHNSNSSFWLYPPGSWWVPSSVRGPSQTSRTTFFRPSAVPRRRPPRDTLKPEIFLWLIPIGGIATAMEKTTEAAAAAAIAAAAVRPVFPPTLYVTFNLTQTLFIGTILTLSSKEHEQTKHQKYASVTMVTKRTSKHCFVRGKIKNI